MRRSSVRGIIHLHPTLLLLIAVIILGIVFLNGQDSTSEKFVASPILAKPNSNAFNSLSAVLTADTAIFNFVFSELNTSYVVDVSTSSRMRGKDIYKDFGSGPASPILVTDPQAKWDGYRCGATIYWRVSSANHRHKSPVQTSTVGCSAPPPPPPPTQETSINCSPPTRTTFVVKPYLVYPADKPMYPEYETAAQSYLNELKKWYCDKVGATFPMQSLTVVRSSYNYDTMRCDPSPFDSTPPSSECLNDPKRLDGNWGMYMNLAIHNGVEKWDEQAATLVFSAGGGGYAGANRYGNDAGWAISGDWVLEPISGIPNDWGIPCKYSDGWQCSGGVPKGTPAHELGHAFGLGHPDPVLYPDPSIMKWHGDYPTVGFLPHEVEFLLQSSFFK